jgi:hypothetical protein
MNHDTKTMVDGAAVVMGLGGFLGFVTPVVALVGGILTIVWTSMRITEMVTGKAFSELLPWNKKKDDAVNK